MTSASGNNRDAQRQAVREQRQRELKRQRSIRAMVIAAVTIVSLVVVGAGAWGLYQAFKPEPETPVVAPKSLDPQNPVMTVGAKSGAPEVDVVLDFMCPFCGDFEEVNGKDLTDLAKQDKVTVNFYIRTFLDELSAGTEYSSRAASAAVCVYEESPDKFLEFQSLLFENQPVEGGPGLTDAQLKQYAKQAGGNAETLACVQEKRYQQWAIDHMEPKGKKKSSATPAVFLNGDYWGDAEKGPHWSQHGDLKKAIEEAPPAE